RSQGFAGLSDGGELPGRVVAGLAPLPEVGGQAPVFVDEFEGMPGVVDHRADLALVSYDAGVRLESDHFLLAKARHPGEVEPGEGLAKGGPLAEDRQPGKSGLETLQRDLLE